MAKDTRTYWDHTWEGTDWLSAFIKAIPSPYWVLLGLYKLCTRWVRSDFSSSPSTDIWSKQCQVWERSCKITSSLNTCDGILKGSCSELQAKSFSIMEFGWGMENSHHSKCVQGTRKFQIFTFLKNVIKLSWLIDDKNSKLDRRHPYKVGVKKFAPFRLTNDEKNACPISIYTQSKENNLFVTIFKHLDCSQPVPHSTTWNTRR